MPVTLTDADLAKITDGPAYVSSFQTDGVGKRSSNTVVLFTLDTAVPAAPVVALGTGVANGATRAEATQPSGAVTVVGESNGTLYVSFVGTTGGADDPNKVVTKIVAGQGPGVVLPVTLTDADLAKITDGPAYAVCYQVDAAGNRSPASAVPFTLDTAVPVAPVVALGAGVAEGATRAEATQASGVVTVVGESNNTLYVSFGGTTGGVDDPNKVVTKVVTGQGAGVPVPVTLTDADLAKITDGPAHVVSYQVDAAGNQSPKSIVPFTLDTEVVAPAVTLGTGVSDGATRAEAQQLLGLVVVRGENKATFVASFVGTTAGLSDPNKIVTKTFTDPGFGGGWPVTLTDAEIAKLTDGLVSVVVRQVDAAGNQSPKAVVAFVLDTVAPSAPSIILGPGVADGATRAEATQAPGVVTVSGEANCPIAVSFVTSAVLTDPTRQVVKTVTGKGPGVTVPVTLTDADLAKIGDGSVNVGAQVVDTAGNAGQFATARFTLDATAPAAPVIALGIGVADGATRTEATQASGIVTVSGEFGAVISVSFQNTDGRTGVPVPGAKVVTKTFTGIGPGSPVRVVLTSADLSSFTDGTVSTTAYQIDAVGNRSPVASVSFAMAIGSTIQFVTVGDAGNAANAAGRGRVGYVYRIAKHDVTIGQYTKFLNAVAKTDTYNLYNPNMGTDLNVAGISRSGTPGSYTYAVMDNGGDSFNRPITYVSWFDAARFANWMHNGQPSGSQGAATTETGAYSLLGATSGTAPARNTGAKFSIPTENEWYKAAFYKGGGTNAGYWTYATRSNTAPGNTLGSGANQANYAAGGRFSVTQSTSNNRNQNYLTDVGAFTGSRSSYGTFDQSGNVAQWTDLNGVAGSTRGVRGGDWSTTVAAYVSSNNYPDPIETSRESAYLGFRLVSSA